MASSELLTHPPDAVAAERTRIGHELHDGVQHHIVAALLCLRLAERELADRSGDAAGARAARTDGRDLLARAARGLTASLAELRAVLDGATDRCDGPDLAAQLHRLAADSPIPVDVHITGHVDAELGPAAYRVVAEALTNTLKHSGAGTAAVTVAAEHGAVWIRVRDDGHGHLPSHPPAALARLVRVAGGELTVSGSRRGTTVTARLPRSPARVPGRAAGRRRP